MLYRLLNDNRMPFLDPGKTLYSPDELSAAFDKRIRAKRLPAPAHGSPALREAVLTACASEPGERFPDAEAFKRALQLSSRKAGFFRRHPSLAIASAVGAASLILIVYDRAESQRRKMTDTENRPSAVMTASPVPGFTDYVIHWKDENLEKTVRKKLNLPDGDIMASQIRYVPSLILTGSGITDISDLKHFTGLTDLKLGNNHIRDLTPLKSLHLLRWLSVSGNKEITDLRPLANLTSLKHLNAAYNRIEDLTPLEGLTNLEYLAVYGNRVRDIRAIAPLKKLRVLWLSNNEIEDISVVSGLTGLKTLYVGSNRVTDISAVTNLTGLETLSIYNNQVTDISPLAGLTRLKSLYLNENPIADYSPIAGFNPDILK